MLISLKLFLQSSTTIIFVNTFQKLSLINEYYATRNNLTLLHLTKIKLLSLHNNEKRNLTKT